MTNMVSLQFLRFAHAHKQQLRQVLKALTHVPLAGTECEERESTQLVIVPAAVAAAACLQLHVAIVVVVKKRKKESESDKEDVERARARETRSGRALPRALNVAARWRRRQRRRRCCRYTFEKAK